MPTLLVNRHMSPELAARVLASVSGRRSSGTPTRRRPITALLRMATFALLATAVGLLLHHRQRTKNELEGARKTLAHTLRTQASALTPADHGTLARVEAAISAQSAPAYAGDFVAEDLRSDEQLLAALRLPTLYLRGPREGLAKPGNLPQLALDSGKDAFALCLLQPPRERTEKALRSKARSARALGKNVDITGNIERVAPLFQALPLLSADSLRLAETAETITELTRLRKGFEAAPVGAAVRAAKARQLLTVMDEVGDPNALTELDGERPHPVRVVLTDLSSGNVRLRFRGNVDPSWISPNTRAEYASGIDSCSLALDVRRAALAQRTVLAAEKTTQAR